MKTLLYLSVFSLITFTSCTEDDGNPTQTELLGTWQLTEILVDPGDGSGEFKPFASDKEIEFLEDGKLRSNSALCVMDSNGGSQNFTGTYDTSKETITPEGCNPDFTFEIQYEQTGEVLILYYTCIEPCAQKYVKVTND